jgi:RimJ/RimL family protein N-acetyltransferase
MALLPDRLSDGVVELRRCGFGDLENAIQAIHESWPELHHWLLSFRDEVTQASYEKELDNQIRRFDDDQDWQYFIVDQRDATIVGMANLYRIGGPERVGIGYWVRTSRTRRGYARRATSLLVAAAFSCVPMVQVVEVQMDVTNLASSRVPQKLGFRRVAEIQRDIQVPGHSGRGLLWEMDRLTWNNLNHAVSSTSLD